uniref:Uncharacterized protein n=1 Tax=Myoviridae sp. ctbEa13 TaxID=2825136 RepID=A0A8S5VBD9_9CAUD|nr:MAG TPA: hypothetical protein [Myoviridae sp. ctbEa13]
MNELVEFFTVNGLHLTLIAILGIVILGALKYTCILKKLPEKYRHLIYLTISLGFSFIASAIYMKVHDNFDVKAYVALCGMIYALNQTFYNIFKITSLNKLVQNIADFIIDNVEKLFKK